MSTTYVPVLLDIFETHRSFLVKELEPSITSVAHSCREADIITDKIYEEVLQVPGTSTHKARKLVNAVYAGIEAQSVGIEQKNCTYQRFVGVLRRDSFEEAAVKLEASRAEIQERATNNVPCTEDVGNQKDPLDQTISSDHRDEISRLIPNWLKYARALKLRPAQIRGIDTNKNLDDEMRGEMVLELWSNKYIATYRILGEVCLKLDHRHIAEKICRMVNGDVTNLSCPDDCVSDSIQETISRVTEVLIGPPAFTSTVTTASPILPGELEVETTHPNQATSSAGGGESQVTGGLTHRRKTSDQLTYAMNQLTYTKSVLRNAQMQSHADESEITSYRDKCDDLKQQLCDTTEEKNMISGQLKDKEKELTTLRYQKRMTESELKSQVRDSQLKLEDMKTKTEQLEEQDRELQEKIAKCEQENNRLTAKLQTYENIENSLLQQIEELKEENRVLTIKNKGRLAYAQLLSDKMDKNYYNYAAACTIVCLGVFCVLLGIFVSMYAHLHPSPDYPHEK